MNDVFCCLWALGGDIGLYAGAFVKDIPLFRECVAASEGMFVPRKGTADEKQKCVEEIGKRQVEIEEGRSTLTPILLFPEGSTSNNHYIRNFRRGAFEPGRSVTPISI